MVQQLKEQHVKEVDGFKMQIKHLSKEREELRKRTLVLKQDLEKERNMHQAVEKIRLSQQALIEMQKEKISKLKEILNSSRVTPGLFRNSSAYQLKKRENEMSPIESQTSFLRRIRQKSAASIEQQSAHQKSTDRLSAEHKYDFTLSCSPLPPDQRHIQQDYREYVIEREKKRVAALEEARERSLDRQREANRTYSISDYELTNDQEDTRRSRESSPCQACLHGSQLDTKPVKQESSREKALTSYTLISKEYINSLHDEKANASHKEFANLEHIATSPDVQSKTTVVPAKRRSNSKANLLKSQVSAPLYQTRADRR